MKPLEAMDTRCAARRASPAGAIALLATTCLLFGSISPLIGQERVPTRARDVEIRGLLKPDARQALAELRAYVATPLGRIPVSGYARLRYTCDGRFSGTVEYSTIVRLLARLKGVALVRSMHGSVTFDYPPACTYGPELVLAGVARTDSFEVRGYIRAATDSIGLQGEAWWDGVAQRGLVISTNRSNRMELRYSMYESATPPAPSPSRQETVARRRGPP
jgi:hypothetical protein